MKNPIQPRSVRRNACANTLETSRNQLAASIALRRQLKQIRYLVDCQEMYVEELQMRYPYSSQFPGDHPELARERAVLQGMKMIAQKLIK